MIAAATLGGAAACSSQDDASDPADRSDLQASATVPRSTGGGWDAVDEEPVDEDVVDLVGAMRATVVADSTTVRLRFDLTSDEGSISQVISGSADFVERRGTSVAEGPVEVEARIDGDRTWLRVDGGSSGAPELPPGVRWIEAPTADLVERGLVNLDPDSTWAPLYLLAGATDVEATGDGWYEFELDLDLVEDGPLSRREREAARFALQYSDPEVFESLGGRVRLDDEGRVIELQLDAVGDADLLGSAMSMTIAVSLSDFDAEVAVERPSGTEVVTVEDRPDLLDQLTRLGAQLETA